MSGWFSSALETIKKGAEDLGEQAKVVGSKMQEEAKKLQDTELLKKTFELDPAYCPEKAPEVPEDEKKAPWERIPESWQNRKTQWVTLSKALCDDENTFLVGPQGRTGIIDKIDFSLPDAPPAEMQIASNEFKQLSTVRFKISPKWVSDTNFWVNFSWKLRELAICLSIEEVEERLRILNTQPEPQLPEGEYAKGKGITQDPSIVQGIIDKIKAARDATAKLESLKATVAEEIKTCDENASLLVRILGRNTQNSDLKESVFESCKYHQQKVQQLISQIEESDQETRFEVPTDGLKIALQTTEAAIEKYHKTPAPAKQEQPATSSSPSPKTAAPATTSDEKKPGGIPQQEDYFGAALPWEDE
eukprot:TRINITY_DN16411_c0_g1_i1.p1 TRINITY_DN16411_c0_g1~~TRINITY_DN16411_c0_g1_i1.p1  ORF type:complete len:361 (+),score=89.69 TRINITY_DN16411_c0_g1_i1:93-1175(+)